MNEKSISKEKLKDVSQKLKDSKVLVVDDDRWIHQIMEKFFNNAGIRSYFAHNPYEAVNLASTNVPDIVILDLRLPDITGDKLLKILKALPVMKNTKFIILSGNIDRKTLGDTYRNGASGYITKPFTLAMLLQKLEAAVNDDVIIEMDLSQMKDSEIDDLDK